MITSRYYYKSSNILAGHSHWANIQHVKGRKDILKSNQFAKIAKEITVCARLGKSGNPDENPRLSVALQKAKVFNFPKERIRAAIDRAFGRNSGSLEFVSYELYGPYRVAFIVETASDNKNRLLPELRAWAVKRGGSMPPIGTFSQIYRNEGYLEVLMNGKSEDDVIAVLVQDDYEADYVIEESIAYINTINDEEVLYNLKKKFEDNGFEVANAEIRLVFNKTVGLRKEEIEIFKASLLKLQEIEGVETINHNAEFDLD